MSNPPSLRHLAKCYGIAMPPLIRLRDRHGIDHATLADPDLLFFALRNGSAGKLRQSLINPARRREIRDQITSPTIQ